MTNVHKVFILFVLTVLCASCGTQKAQQETPVTQIVINDSRVSIINSSVSDTKFDNNNESGVTSESKPTQTTEQITKNGMWIFWTILLAVIVGVAYYVYKKYFKRK